MAYTINLTSCYVTLEELRTCIQPTDRDSLMNQHYITLQVPSYWPVVH